MSKMLAKNSVAKLVGRKVFRVAGRDAWRFLQGTITNNMNAVQKPNDAMYGAFLTTKGRVLGDCNIVKVQDDAFLVDVDAKVEAQLYKHWKRYKLRLKVAIEDETERLDIYTTLPSVTALATNIESATNSNGLFAQAQTSSEALFTDPRGAHFGMRLVLPSDSKIAIPDSFEEMTQSCYHDRRIILGASEGIELSDAIPLEANLEFLNGVAFNKGCYVGQELTARAQFKGFIRKRLIPVALFSSEEEQVWKSLGAFPTLANVVHSLQEISSNDKRPMKNQKLLRRGSDKPIGTVTKFAENMNAAIAMIRLEHLVGAEQSTTSGEFVTSDGAFVAVPFQPLWWNKLDPKSGKLLL